MDRHVNGKGAFLRGGTWASCHNVSLEAFLATEFSEMFSGSRTPSYQFWFFEVVNSTLKMGTESVPEMLENLHILTGLSAREHFNEFMSQVYFGGRFSIFLLNMKIWSLVEQYLLKFHVQFKIWTVAHLKDFKYRVQDKDPDLKYC